jgi:hypothetical protein
MSDKDHYDVLLEERKLLIDAEREGARSFDKYLLTLAAGSFGVTAIFLRDVIPQIEQAALPWLIASWMLFAAAITGTLLSFLVSQAACRKRLDECGRLMSEGDTNPKPPEPKVLKYVDYLNYAAITFLVLGFIAWTKFVYESLTNG